MIHSEGGIVLVRAIGYFLSKGFKNIWRNRMMSFTTICIVAAGLIIFGIFMLISLNINNLLTTIEGQCEINVYLSNDAGGSTISQIEKELKEIDGVTEASFFSKEDRLNRAKETMYKDKEYILEDFEEDNPLRDSYIIKVNDIGTSKQVAREATKITGVEEVNDLQELADNIKQFATATRRIGGILMIMLAFIAIFIIANTIRLCIVSRSDEISIMRFVGASNGYISGPFIVEGIVLGFFGAVLAFGMVSWGYIETVNKIKGIFFDIFSQIMSYDEIWLMLSISFAVIGMGIGVVGSGISLRRFLKV